MPDVKRAMELGKHAADFVSATFIRPVKLEFEKVGVASLCQDALLWFSVP